MEWSGGEFFPGHCGRLVKGAPDRIAELDVYRGEVVSQE